MNDWEVEIVARLLRRFHGWRVSNEDEDRLVWEGRKYSVFSVKSLYLVLGQGRRCFFLLKPFGIHGYIA